MIDGLLINVSILNVLLLGFVAASLNILCLGLIFRYFRTEVGRRKDVEKLLHQQTNREDLVNQIALHIRQPLELDAVLTTTVEEVQRFLQADRVLIYRLNEDGTGCVINETVLPPYPQVLDQTFPEEVFPRQQHQQYARGKTRTITDIEQEDVEPCLTEFVKQFEVKAKLVVPIVQHNREDEGDNACSSPVTETYLWGLLIVHQCRAARVWKPWEVDLMEYLATQVAIAIQKSELYNQLQQLNIDLEQRVQQRTAELETANTTLRDEIAERQRTEEALRHTNQTLQALIKASPRAIVMSDLDNKVKIWNPAAEQMFGWTEADVINQFNPLSPDGHKTYPSDTQASLLSSPPPAKVELTQRKKDGTPIDILYSAAPLSDSEGQISGTVAVIADITEQKRQAEKLRLLESVVVNTNDAVIITEAEPIDEPGPRILYVNAAFTEITGYQPEEVLGKTPRILQGPKTDQNELRKLRTALSQWQPVTVEVINYRKDGSEFWNEFSIVPVPDKQGWYIHWIAVQRDTTGRKRVEQALRQSEARFRTLIENALDIIMILDVDGAIRYVSPSVQKVLGYTVGDLVEQKIGNFIHLDDWLTTRDRLTTMVQHPDKVSPIEFRYRHHDRSWRVLEAISQPFADSAMEDCVMVYARDITERKRLDEVRLALERERELNALKTRFFSMASHEFRTPLSTALAAAQVLENSQDVWDNAEKRLRNLQRIQASIRNMVQLVDDILTINRAEMGKLACNPKPLNLDLYCHHFMEEMQLNADPHHTLTFASQGTVRPVCLDERLLRSMLSNLLSNAIKYSPEGGNIQLTLEFTPDQVQLRVQDQGIGILPEDQRHLFEPFHRGKNVRSIPGAGLGLIVVKKCAELHQGTLEISSEVGVGTTCTVTFC